MIDLEHIVEPLIAPDISMSTGQCKMQTADWRPEIICRLRVKCRLQTTDYRLFKYIATVYFHHQFLIGNRVIQANHSESLQCSS